ncbi:TetR/AcrR family transcriptional regulator [Allokutzneria sp. A3M-2-11 16]|uniref:TetR/AcrR family transcriptional regulator n=1 Tax=Allokutzneria sp. A3M-2-11 16 TaxID=2962043 RepID=UPI0020B8583B|nr:TetR/AcrR family transcriptional regulator [Allokutzneria sp. A3M-2-11 16]MCP3803013.1 TetR/AcrR family transcriptional regulator [Allokutzneria sp. A3M-2-11 16]
MGPTRRRGEELITAIHQAALAELAEGGLGRLSMEGIARRAGTAKTSLYRRWASPEEVLLDAIGAAYPADRVGASGDDLRGDLIASLHRLLEWSRHPTAQAVQAILMERTRNPELVAALYERVFDPAGGRFCATVLRHYAERGEVDARRLTPAVLDIGEALTMKYAVDHGAEPPREYLESIVDEVILPAAGFSPPASSPATGPGRPS